MDNEEHQNILSPNVSRTIVANLQQQSERERASLIQALLSFVGLLIAELMKTVSDAETGEEVVLLQWQPEIHDEVSHMQVGAMKPAPEVFAGLLQKLQEVLEKMNAGRSASTAKCLAKLMADHRVAKQPIMGVSAAEKLDRLAALLATFMEDGVNPSPEDEPWCINQWHNILLPHLRPEAEPARSASSTDRSAPLRGSVGADTGNKDQGYRVKRCPDGEWEIPTEMEQAQLKAHDEGTQRELREEEMADEDAYQRYMASKARSWDDWTVHNALHQAEPPLRKRVRVTVEVRGTSSGTIATGVLHGEAAGDDKVAVTVGVEESERDRPQQGTDVEAEGSECTMPASPHLQPERTHVDDILKSHQGREWYKWWSMGEMDDDMVVKKYGVDGLEVFYAAKVMSQEVEATIPLPEEERVKVIDEHMEKVESEEEGRSRETVEDVVDKGPGQNEVEADETGLMQRLPTGYSAALDGLLRRLESLPAEQAARHAEFLSQHLADLRRPAPHLHRPGLLERQNRLEALLSVFMDQQVNMDEAEQQWCRHEWGNIRPFLENMEGEGDESQEEEGPGPVVGGPEQDGHIVEIEDSQEAIEEGGGQVQVARLADGSVRNLTEEETEVRRWAEAVETEAAEEERRREQERWRALASTAYSSWEQWSTANQEPGQGVKRARVQIRIQGEDGRIVRDEHYMVALRDGEQLAYQVSVRSVREEPEEQGVYAEQATEHMATEMASSSGEGPGLRPAAAVGQENQGETALQDKSHIDVPEFIASPLGQKFYEEWKAGRVGPQIIGQRFGYGVLGAYASMWEDEKEALERTSLPTGTGSTMGSGSSNTVVESLENVNTEGGNDNVARQVVDAEGREGDDQVLPAQRPRRHEGFHLRPPPATAFSVDDSQCSGASGSEDVVVSAGPAEQVMEPTLHGQPADSGEAASVTATEASSPGTSVTEGRDRDKKVQTTLKEWLS